MSALLVRDICDPVSQTSCEVGPWPMWFYYKFRNFILWAFKKMYPLTSQLIVKYSYGYLKFPKCVHFNVPNNHCFGMYLKIIFADFMRGLWYKVTFVWAQGSWIKIWENAQIWHEKDSAETVHLDKIGRSSNILIPDDWVGISEGV